MTGWDKAGLIVAVMTGIYMVISPLDKIVNLLGQILGELRSQNRQRDRDY